VKDLAGTGSACKQKSLNACHKLRLEAASLSAACVLLLLLQGMSSTAIFRHNHLSPLAGVGSAYSQQQGHSSSCK
jgi:hypothetical protein